MFRERKTKRKRNQTRQMCSQWYKELIANEIHTFLFEETQPKPMLYILQTISARASFTVTVLNSARFSFFFFGWGDVRLQKNSIISPSATHWFELRSDSRACEFTEWMKWNDIDALQPLLFSSKPMEYVVQVKRERNLERKKKLKLCIHRPKTNVNNQFQLHHHLIQYN